MIERWSENKHLECVFHTTADNSSSSLNSCDNNSKLSSGLAVTFQVMEISNQINIFCCLRDKYVPGIVQMTHSGVDMQFVFWIIMITNSCDAFNVLRIIFRKLDWWTRTVQYKEWSHSHLCAIYAMACVHHENEVMLWDAILHVIQPGWIFFMVINTVAD